MKSRIFAAPDQVNLDQSAKFGTCILVESSIYVNTSLYSCSESKGRIFSTSGFGSHQKLHKWTVHSGTAPANENAAYPTQSLQCWRIPQPKRRHQILHQLRSADWRKTNKHEVFHDRTRPPPTNTRYPWYAAIQPWIDWAKGWINYTQLPVVLRSPDAHLAKFLQCATTEQRETKQSLLNARAIVQTKASQLVEQHQKIKKLTLPEEYR